MAFCVLTPKLAFRGPSGAHFTGTPSCSCRPGRQPLSRSAGLISTCLAAIGEYPSANYCAIGLSSAATGLRSTIGGPPAGFSKFTSTIEFAGRVRSDPTTSEPVASAIR